jgi:branched-chain amino acid transport system substrate-binding protein
MTPVFLKKDMGEIPRRSLLKGGCAAGAGVGMPSVLTGCLGGNGGSGATGGGELRIGILQPYSGIVGYWGEMSTWGFVSGLASGGDEEPMTVEVEDGAEATFEVGDVTYEMVFRDTELDAAVAQRAATDLVTSEEVDLLFGGISSDGVTRVIENVSKPTDTTYVVGASSGIGIVGNPGLCGRKVFRANEHTGMEARAEARYIGEETETETIYLIGPDNVFGRSFGRTYRTALENNGVEVVGERFVPPGFSEFRGVLEDIDEEAEALGINFTADTLPNFLPTFVNGNVSGVFDLRGYAAFPGRTAMNLIGSTLESELDEITEESISEEAKIGGLASRYHWNQYDNPMNDGFVSTYTETYGTVPDFFTSGSFAAGSAISQAINQGGATGGDEVAEEMYGMTVETTPKGEGGYVFQEHNNQAKSEMTVAKIVPSDEENWNAPIMPSEPVMRVSADEAALPEDDTEMECDLTET